LKGEVRPVSKRQWNSLLACTVRFEDSGVGREIDLLKKMDGVTKDEVFETAVAFGATGDTPAVYVIDPVTLLRVRLHLADCHEGYRSTRALEQASVSAWVAHAWLIEKLDESWAAARRPIEKTLRLLTSPLARRVTRKTGLDVRRALPPAEHPSYPDKFVTEQLPRALAKLG